MAFWERVKKASRRKSPCLTQSVHICGKMVDVCQDSDFKKTLSSTTLDIGLCFPCFSEESEEMKVRKHKNKTSFLM